MTRDLDREPHAAAACLHRGCRCPAGEFRGSARRPPAFRPGSGVGMTANLGPAADLNRFERGDTLLGYASSDPASHRTQAALKAIAAGAA